MSRTYIDAEAATALIDEYHIVALPKIHAGLEFELGDGRTLIFWPGDRDYDDRWELR